MGRRRHEPTAESRKYVATAAGLGATQAGLSAILGISIPTLERHYRKELDTGTERANLTIAGKLYKLAASDENTQAAVIARIFWLKSRARWRESSIIEHAGPDGAPLSNIRQTVVILPDNHRDSLAPKLRPPRVIEGEAVEIR